MGFSLLLEWEWSPAQSYKRLMLAVRDSGSDPIYIPAPIVKQRHTGFGTNEQ